MQEWLLRFSIRKNADKDKDIVVFLLARGLKRFNSWDESMIEIWLLISTSTHNGTNTYWETNMNGLDARLGKLMWRIVSSLKLYYQNISINNENQLPGTTEAESKSSTVV